ncbi:MAG: zf-HC2 domain-containing protein [Candidatus Aminicenantes bacterium]|nr:zf-HC2 domain-containing protein [Candidatus Aminicenantes bacterium]
MKCRVARKNISAYLEGTLDAERLSALENHLASCADCRALLDDLREIAGQAKNLAPLDPPDKVWFKIRAELRERRAAAAAGPGLVRAPARPRFGFRFALASTAALLVVAAGLVVFQPWKPGLSPLEAEKAALSRKTLDKLNEAEWHYHEAIRALREAVESQSGSLDRETAAVFAANIGIVDASIEACRQAVRSDPRDLRARNALLASYGEKVQVLTAWAAAQKTAAPESKASVAL